MAAPTISEKDVSPPWPSDRTLIRIQAASGAVFASFATLHLANSMIANFGHHMYDGLQELLRHFYQNPLVEISLAGALVMHVSTSALRIFRRSQRKAANAKKNPPKIESVGLFSRLKLSPLAFHKYSGYYLAGVLSIHVTATRILPLQHGILADFSDVSFTLVQYPLVFYPYYTLLALSGFYHVYFGLIQSAKVFGIKVPQFLSSQSLFFKGTLALGSVALCSAVLAFGGNYYPIPTDNFPFHQKMIDSSLFGKLLSSFRIGRLPL